LAGLARQEGREFVKSERPRKRAQLGAREASLALEEGVECNRDRASRGASSEAEGAAVAESGAAKKSSRGRGGEREERRKGQGKGDWKGGKAGGKAFPPLPRVLFAASH